MELDLAHPRHLRDLPQRLGDALRRNRSMIAYWQWALVVAYLFLLIVPAVAPGTDDSSPWVAGLGRFAQALFWGLWWPSVILSTMLVGQVWCGLLCPDGTLTEFVSKHGQGRKTPAWMRRPALPIALFAAITLFEYAFDAHQSPLGTLFAIGSTSALALASGVLFGRGKRIWCRYACPVGSVFSLLARCALLHIRVDRAAWDAAPRPLPHPVDCPVLLDIKRMTRSDKCNMCARCSGHRGAVALAWRPLGQEIASLRDDEIQAWEAVSIVFVLIGLAYGAMHWKHSPWNAWWLAHLPLPGMAGLATILSVVGPALLIGAAVSSCLFAAAGGRPGRAIHLAYALIPLGGLGLFLGAIEHALLMLHQAGLAVASTLPWLRGTVLLMAFVWSEGLGLRLLADFEVGAAQHRPDRDRDGSGHIVGGPRIWFTATATCLALVYQFAPNPFH